jgi:AcrR family transcriptional regulator
MTRTSHPTREALIETTLELLEQDGEKIHVDDVLLRSGISKGSLYHHFEDFQDLLNHAMVRRFAKRVDADILELAAGLRLSNSAADFRDALLAHSRTLSSAQREAIRFGRATALGACGSDDRLRSLIAPEQQRLFDAQIDILRDARERGWFNPEFDPAGVVLLFDAWAFGHILSDVAMDPVTSEAKEQIVRMVLGQVLLDVD